MAAALVVLTRALPRRAAMVAHAVVSLAVFGYVLASPGSIGFGLAFVYAPWVLVRALGPERALRAVVVVQALAVLWLRRYAALIPGLGELGVFDHGVAVLGASYVVLRQIQWALHRDDAPDEPTDLGTYTAFLLGGFTLLAGPIVPFGEWRDGFRAKDDVLDVDTLLAAGHRVVRGYLKVAVLAPILGGLSAVAGVEEAGWTTSARLLSFYLYPLFIYVNFAGYCDVVIGLGALAGQRLPENFDRPFSATNIQEFWQRWHMTFTRWLREYVAYPLQMTLRRRRWPAERATAVGVLTVFLFVGLWHGAEWGFLLFGVLHGLAVLALRPWAAVEARWLGAEGRAFLHETRAGHALRWLVFFHFLCATMTLFDRELADAWRILVG